MASSDDYQARAIHCLRLAQTVGYPDSKALLLEMAQAWVKLGQQAREREKEQGTANDINTLLSEYNTRHMLPAARAEPVMQQQQQLQPEKKDG